MDKAPCSLAYEDDATTTLSRLATDTHHPAYGETHSRLPTVCGRDIKSFVSLLPHISRYEHSDGDIESHGRHSQTPITTTTRLDTSHQTINTSTPNLP